MSVTIVPFDIIFYLVRSNNLMFSSTIGIYNTSRLTATMLED